MLKIKNCPKCKSVKEVFYFSKNKTSKDGFQTYCKDCINKNRDKDYHKNYYKDNREVCDSSKKLWAESNKDHVKKVKQKKYLACQEQNLLKKKIYYKDNRESILKSKSSYGKANRTKLNAKNSLEHGQKLERTPVWLTNEQISQIEGFYWLAGDLFKVTGQTYHVDHIVPLRGLNVCGLHVPWNLQVLPSDINIAKGNRFNGW